LVRQFAVMPSYPEATRAEVRGIEPAQVLGRDLHATTLAIISKVFKIEVFSTYMAIPEEITTFASGLRKAKSLYVECPDCGNTFPLYNARLFYGKEPPKEVFYKMKHNLSKATEKVEELSAQIEKNTQEWKDRLDEKELAWRNRLDIIQEEQVGKIAVLDEKLKGFKAHTAVANKEVIKEKVQEALRGQRGVIQGHIAELFPVFRKTRYHPADLLSLIPTTPIDFVIFEGLFQKEVSKIVFLDVKTGGSTLTHVQRTIKDTIEAGDIEFKKLRVDFSRVRGTATEEV
jgi:predicted Holliday junction resolvase-like endonuclease